MTRVDSLPPLPHRPDDGHKGTFGRVLIIAGSRGMSGAACLAGKSALRGGSGLVYVAVPEGVMSIVAGYEPSYLTVPLSEDADGRIDGSAVREILSKSGRMDAIAIGPGLGQSPGLRSLVVELYRTLTQPMVVDADALNLLAKSPDVLGKHDGPRILTPHAGEFARLTGLSIETVQSDRERQSTTFAAEHEVTLVLKGRETIITDGERLAVNETGNSGMGTGGTGDVLTGLTASLLGQQVQGQHMSPFDASQLAAHLHGLAGDHAAATRGQRSLIASDIVDHLHQAWQDVGGE